MSSIPKITPEIAGLIGLGGTVAVSVGGGTFLGHWAGTAWGFEPWGTLSGAGFGILAAGFAIYRAVKRLDQASSTVSNDERSPKNPIPPPDEGSSRSAGEKDPRSP